ncbi:V4R domain-containing protein [Thermococcus sp.]|uniref:V4R domain-containing protein n=1 Tax=Thermococcus sp. TaxID=35749 RepID=UPI00260633DF|nr:V4R domain-containing protein [Thermococcus sp.]
MIPVGIKPLDSALGGGIKEGSTVAFIGSIEYDHVILMHQTVLNALKMGNKVLLVDFRQPPHMLLEELRNHGIDYSPYIENGSLLILDGYSNLYGQSVYTGKNVLPNPLDLGITTALIRETISRNGFDLFVIDDLTSHYILQPNPKSYVKATVRLVNSVKFAGVGVLAAACSDVFTRSDLTAILIPFGYIIETSEGMLRLKRSPYPVYIPEPVFRYVRTREGIISTREYYSRFEGLKNRLKMDEKGRIMLDNLRVQIVDEYSERALIETVYDFLGPKEGETFLYSWGKKQYAGHRRLSKRYSPDLRDALEDIFSVTEASGGGRLEIVELSNDRIIVRGTNLFPEGKGYLYPLHVHYAGSVAQFLTELTGNKWEGKETKCEAMGADYCEFVFERK